MWCSRESLGERIPGLCLKTVPRRYGLVWTGLVDRNRESSQLYVQDHLFCELYWLSPSSWHQSIPLFIPLVGFKLVTHLSPQKFHTSSAAFLSIRANDLAAGNILPQVSCTRGTPGSTRCLLHRYAFESLEHECLYSCWVETKRRGRAIVTASSSTDNLFFLAP